MHEYVIVCMVDPAQVGDRFTMWPLHITLLPWFDAPDVQTVKEVVEQKLQGFRPFTVSVGKRSSFGVDKRLPVMLIQPSHKLQDLHDTLLTAVQEQGWELHGRYTGSHFVPHVTQKAGRDASGDIQIETLHIAEKQSQGYRQIVGELQL